MGRKDAGNRKENSFTPIDTYRKQIGKQAAKVEKKVHKEGRRQEARSVDRSSGLRTGTLLVAILFAILLLGYLFIYMCMKVEDEHLRTLVLAINAQMVRLGSGNVALITVALIDLAIFTVFSIINL